MASPTNHRRSRGYGRVADLPTTSSSEVLLAGGDPNEIPLGGGEPIVAWPVGGKQSEVLLPGGEPRVSWLAGGEPSEVLLAGGESRRNRREPAEKAMKPMQPCIAPYGSHA